MAIEKRKVGQSALEVSAIGLGCNNFGLRVDLEQTRAVVDHALALGVTLFDTADRYGNPPGTSETYLGQVLGERRKSIVLASKFGNPMDASGQMQGASRRYIKIAVEASLRRLKTDWIDLYQMHRPDPTTPIEETLRALEDLVRQGHVRYVGCSTLSAPEVVAAQVTAARFGLASFVSCQERYSLLEREVERDMMPAIAAHNLGLIPFSPLANGLLTGKYRRGRPLPQGARLSATPGLAERYLTERNWQTIERLAAFCEARGRTLLELAFGWLLQRPAVASVIAGATTPEQAAANVRAASWSLSREDMDEIDRLTAN